MNKQSTRILIFVLIGAITLAFIAFYSAVRSTLPQDSPNSPTFQIPSVQVSEKIRTPQFNLYVKSNGKNKTLVIEWRDLPFDTRSVNIYRSKDKNTWELWKTLPVSAFLDAGSTEVGLAPNEVASNYYYRAEALSGIGETTWESSSTPISNQPLPPVVTSTPPSSPSSTPSSPQTQPQTSTTPSTSSPVVTPPASSSTPPANQPPSSNTSSNAINPKWIYYYNPLGQLIGTSSIQSDPFFVVAINNTIKIGWQNLPTNANGFIVYRSEFQGGPWTELLEQTNIDPQTPGSIQIQDSSIGRNHYYKMITEHDGVGLETYGPVFVAAQ